jgi:hypothetical protein
MKPLNIELAGILLKQIWFQQILLKQFLLKQIYFQPKLPQASALIALKSRVEHSSMLSSSLL